MDNKEERREGKLKGRKTGWQAGTEKGRTGVRTEAEETDIKGRQNEGRKEERMAGKKRCSP